MCAVLPQLSLLFLWQTLLITMLSPVPSASACFPTKCSSQPLAPESCCPVESPGDLYKLLIPGFHADITGMQCDLGIRSFKSPG